MSIKNHEINCFFYSSILSNSVQKNNTTRFLLIVTPFFDKHGTSHIKVLHKRYKISKPRVISTELNFCADQMQNKQFFCVLSNTLSIILSATPTYAHRPLRRFYCLLSAHISHGFISLPENVSEVSSSVARRGRGLRANWNKRWPQICIYVGFLSHYYLLLSW